MFDEYKKMFNEISNFEDQERAHVDADRILQLIALSAASGNLTYNETFELIGMFNKIEKWYA